MKETTINAVKNLLASSAVCLALFLSIQAQTTINYTESDEIIANPERGLFTYTDAVREEMKKLDCKDCKDIEAERRNNFQTVVYRQYSLRKFLTKPLDKKYLAFLDADAETARKAGVKMILRFSYADDGHLSDDNCGNHDSKYASAAVVNQHISSLKDYFLKSKDVITLVEAGFIGNYGEWAYAHSEFGICDPNYDTRAATLKLLLDTVPAEIPIALRTPRYKRNIIDKWTQAGLPQDQIDVFARRIGFANDCFLDNANDQETFKSNEERKYLQEATKDVPMVGESCTTARKENSYAAWSNAKEDLKNQHWTLLSADDNGRFWKPGCFCDVSAVDNTGLCKGDKCMPEDNCKNCKCADGVKCVPFTRWNAEQFKELRKRLGYRVYLTQAEFPEDVKVNDPLRVKVSLSNAGRAAPYRNRRVEVYLCKNYLGACPDAEKILGTLDQVIDIRAWYASSDPKVPIKFSFSAAIPTSGLSPGTYYLFLRLPDDNKELSSRAEFSIRLANNSEGTDQNQKKRPNVFDWNVTSGANRFGSMQLNKLFRICPSQEGAFKMPSHLPDLSGMAPGR